MRRSKSALLPLLALGLLAPSLAPGQPPAPTPAAWESTVTPFIPGAFPPLRPQRVRYDFGWNGVTAASGQFRYSRTPDNQLRFDATGGTVGFARKLWAFDVIHLATAAADTFRPVHVRELETIRARKLDTELTFGSQGVSSHRAERRGSSTKSKTRTFDFPDVLSINSAFLFLRSLPLTDGSAHHVVVYPSTSAYLCTVTVQGRESVSGPLGARNAIKLDIQLTKIGKKRELQPHRKFRRATVWLADDSDRLILRIEAQVFIGTVFAELQSVQLDKP
ncbi:hypothetical protein BH20VER2_BH20VER2_02350 [soil metagenome]